MEKKNRRRINELPKVGSALEIPNYVTPMTDLEYREVTRDGETSGCSEDCGRQNAENCGD